MGCRLTLRESVLEKVSYKPASFPRAGKRQFFLVPLMVERPWRYRKYVPLKWWPGLKLLAQTNSLFEEHLPSFL